MSETTASGAGGSATPGWYTDPNDPNQLRWWSGEGWTEHVSGGAAPQVAAQPVAAPAQPIVEQPVAQQPVVEQPMVEQPIAQQPVAPQQFGEQPVAPQQPSVPSAGDPLPSRRAMRDPASEAPSAEALAPEAAVSDASAASAAAEAALAGQRAQADQAALQAQQQAAYAQPPQQAAQPEASPLASSEASAPAPTLPVQPQSFLQQAGYAPMDGTAQPQAAQAEAVPPQAAQPQALQPPAVQQSVPQAPAQVAAPQQPAQMPQAPQQVQPLDANAWDQAAAAAGPYSTLAPTQNQWNQPVAPESQPPAAQQGWGTPGTANPAIAPSGMDALFGGAPAADPAAAGWGLSPGAGQPDVEAPGAEYGSRRRGAETAASETAGSSTFWGWLIAISPIIAAGAIGYVLASTGYVFSGWPIQAAIAAPYLLVLLFALADRAGLQNLGHSSPRSPAWALLSAPVYLIVRASETRREDGTGTGLTLVWFVSFLVGLGGFIGYGLLTHHALIAGLPT